MTNPNEAPRIQVVYKPLSWFKPYARNPRKNDDAVDRMVDSIIESGSLVPLLGQKQYGRNTAMESLALQSSTESRSDGTSIIL